MCVCECKSIGSSLSFVVLRTILYPQLRQCHLVLEALLFLILGSCSVMNENTVATTTIASDISSSSVHSTVHSQQEPVITTTPTTKTINTNTTSTDVAGAVTVGCTTGNNVINDGVNEIPCQVIETPSMSHSNLLATDRNNTDLPLLSPSKPPSSPPTLLPLPDALNSMSVPDSARHPHRHEEQAKRDELAVSESAWRGRRQALSFEECAAVFNMPVARAAAALGVSRPTIAKVLRARGIRRWPYRRLRADHRLDVWGPEAAAAAAAATLASASASPPPPRVSSSLAAVQKTAAVSSSTTSASSAPSSSPSLPPSPPMSSPSSSSSSSSSSSALTPSMPSSSSLPIDFRVHRLEKSASTLEHVTAAPRSSSAAVASSSDACDELSSSALKLDPSFYITISHILQNGYDSRSPLPTSHSHCLSTTAACNADAPDTYSQPLETHGNTETPDMAIKLPECDDSIFDSNRRWFTSGQWAPTADDDPTAVSSAIVNVQESSSQTLLLDHSDHVLDDHTNISGDNVLCCTEVYPAAEDDPVDALLRLTDVANVSEHAHKGDVAINRAILSSHSWSSGELRTTEDGDVYFAFSNDSDEGK